MQMENMSFEELVKINCFSKSEDERDRAADLLEQRYCCEINCDDMDESVLFAHHARGCTVVAAKICENVVIYQNVTIGSNQRYNRQTCEWENLGVPILARNVIVCDGAKILGPVIVGENTVVGAGAIVTIDVPPISVAFGVNRYKAKDENYDLVFRQNMPGRDEILAANEALKRRFADGQAKP